MRKQIKAPTVFQPNPSSLSPQHTQSPLSPLDSYMQRTLCCRMLSCHIYIFSFFYFFKLELNNKPASVLCLNPKPTTEYVSEWWKSKDSGFYARMFQCYIISEYFYFMSLKTQSVQSLMLFFFSYLRNWNDAWWFWAKSKAVRSIGMYEVSHLYTIGMLKDSTEIRIQLITFINWVTC